MGMYCAMVPLWCLMVPFRPLWSIIVIYSALWSIMVHMIPEWSSMVLYDPIGSCRVSYCPLGSLMVMVIPYCPLWSWLYSPLWWYTCSRMVRLIPFSPLLFSAVHFGVPYSPLLSIMAQYNIVLSRRVPYGPVWSHMVPYGPIWSCLVPNGFVWPYMAPFVLALLILICPHRSLIVSLGYICFPYVNLCNFCSNFVFVLYLWPITNKTV